MVLPLIAAGIAAAATMAQVAAGNNQARIQSIMAQRQLAAQREAAERQYELSTAGSRTARGDTTQFVPGVGWVETLSPGSRALEGASDAEASQRLNVDLPRAREGRDMNFDARLNERGAADTLLRQFEGQTGRSPAAIEAAMIERNVAAANDPVDAMRSNVQINALRGNSGAGDALAALSREGARGTRSAIADARLAAPGAAEEENASRRNNTLNQYNTLATRASNIDDVPFQPSNITDTLTARNMAQAKNAPNAVEGASTALRRGYMDTVSNPGDPGTNWGMAIGGLGRAGMMAYDYFDRGGSKPTGWKTPAASSSSGGGGTSGVQW
jgi:hypothetical protein